ncbi:hypothetical protein HAX54_001905 [Datura stramonium]|uniref:Oleosin n=1 Tax=Datura stramonium TaxID=4076 RepID=A0ABS8RTI1_DATST|nr:hypothetical protein [Datura stramonium]
MAARSPNLRPIHTASSYVPSFLRKLLQPHVPNSTQLMGFLTLVISGGILLLLTGVTLTTVILSIIFFTPLIILSSPLWFPIAALLFIAAAGFLSLFGLTWVYRYLIRGSATIEDDSTHILMKDYATQYGHGKVKDTAPDQDSTLDPTLTQNPGSTFNLTCKPELVHDPILQLLSNPRL